MTLSSTDRLLRLSFPLPLPLALIGLIGLVGCTDDGVATEAGDAGTEAGSTAGETAGTETGDSVDCSGRPIAVPSARGEIDGVWDADHGRMLIFAGDEGTPVMCMSQTEFISEVWAFHPDCDNFEQLAPSTTLPPRGRHAVALDQAHGRALIHGGRYRAGTSGAYTLYDDLWAFDFATDSWTELPSAGGPSARSNHVAVVSGDHLIVYGGNASTDGLSFIPLGDTWAFDLEAETWTQVSTTNDPSARLFHTATVEPATGILLMFGGGDANAFVGPFFRDLWALELAPDAASGTWTMLDNGLPGPPGTTWADLVWDDAGQRVVLWAGHDDGALGNTNTIWTWPLVGNGWTQAEVGDVQSAPANGFCDFPVDFVVPDLDAPERRSAGATVVTDSGELLVFGGKTDCGQVNDVWAWSLSEQTWTERSPATGGEICLRAFANCQTMCF